MVPAQGDMVAVVGQNRRLLVFALSELPEMTRGKGVILQRYRDGELADIKVFESEAGLTWQMGGGRTRTETDLLTWTGKLKRRGNDFTRRRRDGVRVRRDRFGEDAHDDWQKR